MHKFILNSDSILGYWVSFSANLQAIDANERSRLSSSRHFAAAPTFKYTSH